MCTTCVAEGAAYAGSAVVALRLMGARASRRLVRRSAPPPRGATEPAPEAREPA